MALDILIVDDERDIRELVAGVLSDEGYECRTAGDSTSALEAIDDKRPSLVLLDVWLHGSPMDGLEVLDAIKAREPDLPVIIFSGHGNIDTAVSAVSRPQTPCCVLLPHILLPHFDLRLELRPSLGPDRSQDASQQSSALYVDPERPR